MKIIKIISITIGIIISILIAILIYTTVVTSKQKIKISNNKYKGSIGYSQSGHILVYVKINGSEKTYPFILDNGAKTTIFDNILTDFNFSTVAYLPSRDVNKKLSFKPVFRIDTLTINNNIIVSKASAILHSSKIFKCDKNIYGIIGKDLMKELIWQFDFENNKYFVTNNINNLKFKKDTFSVNFSGKGKINILINNNETELLIDLGSTSSIKYKVKIRDNDKYFKNKWLKIYGNTGFGLNGYNNSIKTSQVYIDSIQFGNKSFYKIDGVIAEKTLNIIGLDFLKNFNLTFDFPNKKIFFAPNNKQFFRRKHFGFKPIIKDSTLQIGTLFEGSILEEKGVKVGDPIVKINNINIDKEFNLCNFNPSIFDTLNISVKIFDDTNSYKLIRYYYFKK